MTNPPPINTDVAYAQLRVDCYQNIPGAYLAALTGGNAATRDYAISLLRQRTGFQAGIHQMPLAQGFTPDGRSIPDQLVKKLGLEQPALYKAVYGVDVVLEPWWIAWREEQVLGAVPFRKAYVDQENPCGVVLDPLVVNGEVVQSAPASVVAHDFLSTACDLSTIPGAKVEVLPSYDYLVTLGVAQPASAGGEEHAAPVPEPVPTPAVPQHTEAPHTVDALHERLIAVESVLGRILTTFGREAAKVEGDAWTLLRTVPIRDWYIIAGVTTAVVLLGLARCGR